jgi:tetrahydromethanopterin S-methyltransferase subunit B
MAALGSLYREKLVEIQERIHQLKALEEELQASVDFTQQCSPCHPGTEVSHCGNCALHKSVTVPILVAVVQESIQDQTG